LATFTTNRDNLERWVREQRLDSLVGEKFGARQMAPDELLFRARIHHHHIPSVQLALELLTVYGVLKILTRYFGESTAGTLSIKDQVPPKQILQKLGAAEAGSLPGTNPKVGIEGQLHSRIVLLKLAEGPIGLDL